MDAFRTSEGAITRLADALGAANVRLAMAERARTDAQAKAVLPDALREQLRKARAVLRADIELGNRPADATHVAALQSQLAQAEREAPEAIETADAEAIKASRLKVEAAAMTTALQQMHAARPALLMDHLWELLATKAAALTDARSAFVERLDEAFAVATAIDIMAGAEGAPSGVRGRFASSGNLGELQLPLLPTMAPLPYSADTHHQRVRTRAMELLKELQG
jgi:hypothetical protein